LTVLALFIGVTSTVLVAVPRIKAQATDLKGPVIVDTFRDRNVTAF
jgi:hypothetical protein